MRESDRRLIEDTPPGHDYHRRWNPTSTPRSGKRLARWICALRARAGRRSAPASCSGNRHPLSRREAGRHRPCADSSDGTTKLLPALICASLADGLLGKDASSMSSFLATSFTT